MVALAWNGPSLSASLVIGLWLLVTSLVGGAVAARRSSNPIGWLLLATGVFIGLSLFAQEYAVFSLGERPGSLPLGRAMARLSSWLALPGFLAFALVLILFPSGRPPFRRWGRPLVRAAITLSVIQTLALALTPGPIDGVALDGVALADNPLGLQGAEPGLESAFTISGTLLVFLALLGVVSRLVGFRFAPAEERQQIKWVVSAIGLLLVTFFGNIVGSSFLKENEAADDIVAFFIPMVAVLLIPVAIGIAILKYRLYDIDLLINRGLVYGSLTGVLVLVYIAGVFGAGGLIREVTPGEESNSLVVAASTLAVAAAFQPVRERLQIFIDRRFYRAKYDASKTLEDFSARLRNEVDLDASTADLCRLSESPCTQACLVVAATSFVPPGACDEQGKMNNRTAARLAWCLVLYACCLSSHGPAVVLINY